MVRANLSSKLTSFAAPAGLSFGRVNPDKFAKKKVETKLHNLSASERSYTITHTPNQTFAGVTISGPTSITVPAHSKKKIKFTLKMDASLGNFDSGFYSQTEVDGWFTLSDGKDELRVGYMAAVDPASKIKIKSNEDKNTIVIKNKGVTTGFAEGFTLAGKNGLLLNKSPNAIKALGYRNNDFFGASNIVEFGIVTERPWESPSAYEIDILIDADSDGIFEKILVAADIGFLTTGIPSGTLVTAVFGETGGYLLFDVDTDLNDDSAILSFFRNDIFGLPLGFLPVGDTDFDYEMYIFDNRSDSVDVQIGSVDLGNEIVPEIATLGLLPGTTVTQTASGKAEKMLWLLQNNQAKKQAKIIKIED